MGMRELQRTAAACCIISLLALGGMRAWGAQADVEAGELAITHGPYLQAASETGMTIVWATNRNCVSRVEYGPAPDGPASTASAGHHGLIDANITLHRVSITGLEPGRTYYYRAISTEIVDFKAYKVTYGGTIRSADGRFTTLDAKKKQFSFVVLNDRHEKVKPLRTALDWIDWGTIDLAFLVGDMINDPMTEQQTFKGLIDPCVSFFAGRIPFILVRGNHETRGTAARGLMDYFPTDSQRYYHSMSHGGVRFIMLDGGEDKADTSPEYSGLVDFESYLKQETEWLRQEIQSEGFGKANLRVVMIHVPPTGMEDPKFIREKWVLDHWGPLFDKGKVDLVISGHTHQFEEIGPREGKNSYPILIGDTETVMRVDVSEGRMSVTVSGNDGTVRRGPVRQVKSR